ncbi:MAG: DUF11 domain-containing protein [Proteobacteria bacterium]|nr:DUF11 domain-containing protein [Pseudomonadota bacterium]
MTRACLTIVIGAAAALVLPHAARAATCSPAASAGTAPADWGTYCWLDFSSYSDAVARAAGGQPFTFNLPDGSTLTLTATVTATAATALKAVPAPAWSGAAVGNTAFLGVPGKPILYTASSGTVTIQFTGITLTPPPGVTGGSTYSFVAADGESTNQNESLAFTTNGANWTVLDQVPPISGNAYPTITNTGSTFTETGVAGTVGGYIVGSLNATQVSTVLVAGGLQGAMFALRYSIVSLNAQLSSGRVSASDQFLYKISATNSGTVLSSGTSTGAGNGPFTPTSSFVTTPQPLTLSEAMAPGSASLIGYYIPSLTCTNAATGSPTVLPSNQETTSYVIGSIAFGDSISCVFTNTKTGALLGLAKSGPSPGLKVGGNSTYTLTVTNTGPLAASQGQVKDQLPAGLTFVSATGTNWSCGNAAGLITCSFSGGTIASGASSTITVTVTPAAGAAGTQVTNYASIDPTGGSGAPTPGAGCSPAASCASAGPSPVVYINPQPESGTATAGTASTPIASVASNDAVNGAAATLGAAGNATVAQSGTWPAGVTLDTASGAINTTAVLSPGTYSLSYQLCDKATPPNCATTTDTLTVKASIVPVAEAGTAPAGKASTPIPNVAANDTVNGAPATLGAAGNATVAQSGSWPAGVTLNTTSGAIATTAAVPPGVYSVVYQLCDKSAPPNCATTTDTVTVSASILPGSPSGSAVAGTAATPIANIATGSSVNGSAATLGSGGNATAATSGTWAVGLALNASSGAVTTTAQVPPGTYSLMFQLCDRSAPPNCATGTATVTVSASILPVPESGTAVSGIASTAIPNVAANDHVNGAPATLGPSGNATVAPSGTWPAGVTLNTTTGAVATDTTVIPGSYSIVYQLCDRSTPPNCATATDTLKVAGSALPVVQKGTATAGIPSTAIPNVLTGATVNGAPATLGSGGNATLAATGTWPKGLTLNTATGALTTTADLPPGTYAVGVRLCSRDTPPVCASATDQVIVTALTGGALSLDKSASKTQADLGDSVQFRLRLRNTGTNTVPDIKLSDALPLGFKLIPGSVQVALEPGPAQKAPDPQGAPGPQLTFSVGSLAAGAVLDIYYQTRIGVGADRGDGINRAQAQGAGSKSQIATAQVLVSAGGAFDVHACVVGKIFVDCNGNRLQDAGEPGIPGVRVYFEDGTSLTSDENGNYSLCGLNPVTHVLKVDGTTLPAGSRLVVLSSRNAGDGNSLFVDLKDGELHRADFAEGSCTNKVMEDVRRRRTLPAILAPQPPAGREHVGVDFDSKDGPRP